MSTRTPAQVFPPGEFVKEELDARGWTQADLADVMGRPRQLVNELISGKKELTPETARDLGEAFGTSADVWMNLESAYRLSQVQPQTDAVARRARLYSIAPIKEMVKRGWISMQPDVANLEGELMRFFEVKTLEAPPDLSFSFRAGASGGEASPAQRAWLCRAKKLARAVSAAQYDPTALKQGLLDLHELMTSEHDVRRVPRLLAEIGIRLTVVEPLPASRVDGAAIWVDERTPAIALSTRFDRIDCFWYTLCHELMHIKNGDKGPLLDDSLVGQDAIPTKDKPDYEQRADQEAAEYLVPQKEIDGFISRVRPLYSKTRIAQFAGRIRVHPGIVVGQLQRRGEIRYASNREMLVKIRDQLTQAALTDGWGHTAPAL